LSIGLLIKQSISFCIEPLGLVLLLLSFGIYFLYKQRYSSAKIFLLLGVSLLLLFSSPSFSNFLVTQLENQYPQYNYKKRVNYIHVLGNGHNTDKDQPISSHLTDSGTKRVLEGVILHRAMPNTKIIFTGYEGDTNRSNAQMNAALAIALGVEHSSLIIGSQPEETREEALFTKSIVGDEPFVLVTSATHMPRAMMLFHLQGMNPIAAPTAFYKEQDQRYLQFPSLHAFLKSQIAIHEYIGMLWVKIRG
jgi:uncharacterized SAM-binding protein YcdF (DUF218 family)